MLDKIPIPSFAFILDCDRFKKKYHEDSLPLFNSNMMEVCIFFFLLNTFINHSLIFRRSTHKCKETLPYLSNKFSWQKKVGKKPNPHSISLYMQINNDRHWFFLYMKSCRKINFTWNTTKSPWGAYQQSSVEEMKIYFYAKQANISCFHSSDLRSLLLYLTVFFICFTRPNSRCEAIENNVKLNCFFYFHENFCNVHSWRGISSRSALLSC